MKRLLIVIIVLFAFIAGGLALLGITSDLSTTIPDGYKGQYRTIAGIKLRVWQEGEGQDVLLIHGLPGSIEAWDPVAAKLAEQFRVTIYDRPGHGFSEFKPSLANLRGNIDVAYALIDELKLKDVIVVGHSYGGSMVTAMAQEDPSVLAGYLSVAGAIKSTKKVSPIYQFITLPTIGPGFARLGNTALGPDMMAKGLRKAFGPNPVPEGFQDARTPLWLSVKSSLAIAHEQVNLPRDLEALQYDSLASPFHMIYGKQDRSIPLSNARAILGVKEKATLNALDNTGHMVQFIHPEVLVDAIWQLSSQRTMPDNSTDAAPGN